MCAVRDRNSERFRGNFDESEKNIEFGGNRRNCVL